MKLVSRAAATKTTVQIAVGFILYAYMPRLIARNDILEIW